MKLLLDTHLLLWAAWEPDKLSPAALDLIGDTANDLTFKGQGNGIVVEATMLSKNLSSGQQQVKIKVTRNGNPESGTFIDVTARLDARRFRSIKVDRTNNDGFTVFD